MKLATRCNRCGTLFGVVRDQLWVSGGWVRCGRCGSDFNAYDRLYDLTQGKPPAWIGAGDDAPEQAWVDPVAVADPVSVAMVAAPETAEGSTRASPVEASTAATDELEAAASLDALPEESTSGAWQAAGAEAGPIPPTATTPSELPTPNPAPAEVSPPFDPVLGVVPGADDDLQSGQARHLPQVVDEPEDAARENLVEPVRPVGDAPAFAPPATTPAGVPTPGFLRRAEKQARWSRPSVRLALGSVGLVALLVLTLQTALHFRHGLAAESTPARHALTWLCAKLGCRIEAPRRIADLTVESSVLTRVAGSDQLIRLSMTLRNRSRVALAMPALDLTLKDGAGKVLVRRAIQPQEVPAAPATLPAGIDVPLQLLVATDGRRIAAYTVEIFYP